MKKNLVVLSGGGFKASYQVGALKAFKEKGMKIDCLMGTSGGALNGLLVSQDKLQNLEYIWSDIAHFGIKYLFTSTLIDLNTLKFNVLNILNLVVPKIKLNLFFKKNRTKYLENLNSNLKNINYLASSDKLFALLYGVTKKEDIKIPFYFNFTDLDSSKEIIVHSSNFNSNYELAKGVLASGSIPVFCNPITVTTNNKVYHNCVDGGISSNILISKAIKYIKAQSDFENWRIIVIDCNIPIKTRSREVGVLNIFRKVLLDIMLNNLSLKELKTVSIINELVKSNSKYKEIDLIHIFPTSNIGKTLEVNSSLNKKRIKRGYVDTKTAIKFLNF